MYREQHFNQSFRTNRYETIDSLLMVPNDRPHSISHEGFSTDHTKLPQDRFYNYYCYYNKHSKSNRSKNYYDSHEKSWREHCHINRYHEYNGSNMSIISDNVEPLNYKMDADSVPKSKPDCAKRFSISNGSIFFPSMSLHDLDKIDSGYDQSNFRNIYKGRDALLFVSSHDSCEKNMSKVDSDKSNDLNNSLSSFHKMEDNLPWEAMCDGPKNTALRRDSIYTISSSRRSSINSFTEEFVQGEASMVSLEKCNLNDDEYNCHSVQAVKHDLNDSFWDEYGNDSYDPIPYTFNEATYFVDQYDPNFVDQFGGNYQNPVSVEADEQEQRRISFSDSVGSAYADIGEAMDIGADKYEIQAMMKSLVTSMSETLKSQQSIHDWDKKMGLKRSHSKTMRNSMRTRKKLRVLVKKELNVK